LQLINVNITDITDESGYIDAIGQKAATEAIQQARGDVADNEKMGEIASPTAEREKAVSRWPTPGATRRLAFARPSVIGPSRWRIWRKNRRSARKKPLLRAGIASQGRRARMRVRVADADASAIDGENIAQANHRGFAGRVGGQTGRSLPAGRKPQEEAEAKVLEVQNRAMALAALAEAERVEAEQRAQLEARAKAEKAKMVVDAEAVAEKRIEAQGEADAIFASLDAEARGQYEILAKKGQGLQQIVTACGGAKEAFQMMLLEHLEKLAETSAQAISNIKFDKVIVWEGGGNGEDGRGNTAGFSMAWPRRFPRCCR
jgi:flotillin